MILSCDHKSIVLHGVGFTGHTMRSHIINPDGQTSSLLRACKLRVYKLIVFTYTVSITSVSKSDKWIFTLRKRGKSLEFTAKLKKKKLLTACVQ